MLLWEQQWRFLAIADNHLSARWSMIFTLDKKREQSSVVQGRWGRRHSRHVIPLFLTFYNPHLTLYTHNYDGIDQMLSAIFIIFSSVPV